MKMKAILGVVVSALALSACSLTSEQIAKIDREHTGLSNALIPACINTGLGQKPDYSALRGLGYTQRDTLFGSGDYFYSPDKTFIYGANKNVRFNSGKGCTVTITSESDLSLNPIGRAWHRQLAAKGYEETGTDPSRYQFTANGVPFAFAGRFELTDQSAAITTLTIERER